MELQIWCVQNCWPGPIQYHCLTSDLLLMIVMMLFKFMMMRMVRLLVTSQGSGSGDNCSQLYYNYIDPANTFANENINHKTVINHENPDHVLAAAW